MEIFRIIGGKRLEGTVLNQASKNAALPILAASILTDEEVVLRNIPRVLDTRNMIEVLKETGARILDGNNVRIRASNVITSHIDSEAAKKIRSSILLLASLISKFPNVKVPIPGGDSIGTRKIDALILGLRKLGVEIKENGDFIRVVGGKLRGAEIELNFPSVTGTEGTIIASCVAEGKTVINNAAKEPEIVDLAHFLNSMGAQITGAGTETIKVVGVEKLHGTEYSVIPDRIAAGTYMVAASMTGGNLTIDNVEPRHLEAITQMLEKTGSRIAISENSLKIESSRNIKARDVTTDIYPGFPTDMQPLFMSMMTIAEGTSRIKETLYDGRFTHVKDLKRMGADIEIVGDVAIVKGVKGLRGSKIEAADIRSGAALTIAGLAAAGTTEISNVCQIDRGYEALENTLRSVGAEIERLKE